MGFDVTDSTPEQAEARATTVPTTPIDKKDTVLPGDDVEDVGNVPLMNEAVDSFIDRALEKLDLPTNSENKEKALNKVIEKLNTWMEQADFDLGIDVPLDTEKAVKKALVRKGLDDTADGIKKLIDMMEDQSDS